MALEGVSLEKILFLSRTLINLWNLARAEAERWLATGEESVTAYSFNYWLTGIRKTTITLEDGTPVSMADVPSDSEREVLRKLAGSYQSFFALKKNRDSRARKPAEKKECWFQTMSWSSFKVVEDKLVVPGYQGESIEISLKCRDKRSGEFSSNYLEEQIGGKSVAFATLSRNPDGEFELSLVVSEPQPVPVENPTLFRAIDLGAGNMAVTDSDGGEFLVSTRRPDKIWMDRIAKVEARQEKRAKGSRGYKRLAAARRYMHSRSRNQKDSHQKKVASALAANVHCIIVGKPRTRLGLARAENATPVQHYGVQNTGYMFRQLLYLKHKAEERGIRFVELPDPRRKGALENPENKFYASRELLREGLVKTASAIAFPTRFERREFTVNFGG